MCAGTPSAARLFVSVAHELAEPLHDQLDVLLDRELQAARHCRRTSQLAEFVQPRVLVDLDPAPAEPGQLGGAQRNGRNGPVDRKDLLPALIQSAGQGHGRLVGHRQQERRIGCERRRSHTGADDRAGCTPNHQPPIAVGLRDSIDLRRQQPVRDGSHDGADYRVGGQMFASYREELGRGSAELQARRGYRGCAHLRNPTVTMGYGHGIFRVIKVTRPSLLNRCTASPAP
uniref:hypothetical protein n=1 Tax=Micromonospora chokoriensis TaxID=356851 RepID=UPI001E4C35DD|nr:hypothetical protein [Micromonospora chokoriensis]